MKGNLKYLDPFRNHQHLIPASTVCLLDFRMSYLQNDISDALQINSLAIFIAVHTDKICKI